MDGLMSMLLRVAAVCILCAFMLFLNARLFRRTIPVDPQGLYGAPAYFAQANGAAALYGIIACAGIVTGTFLSVWGTYICSGLLALVLVVSIVQQVRSTKRFRSDVSSQSDAPEKEQAQQMMAIISQARLLVMLYIVVLGFLVSSAGH